MGGIIKLIALDVDGTLTDGGIYYGSDGTEYKRFCAQDGAGILAAQKAGVEFVIMTARESPMVLRRATDLKIRYVYQNVWDKKEKLQKLMVELGLSPKDIAYFGDDIIDLGAMSLCAFVACPCNACKEVKAASNYISSYEGGHGAVRDILEHMIGQKLV